MSITHDFYKYMLGIATPGDLDKIFVGTGVSAKLQKEIRERAFKYNTTTLIKAQTELKIDKLRMESIRKEMSKLKKEHFLKYLNAHSGSPDTKDSTVRGIKNLIDEKASLKSLIEYKPPIIKGMKDNLKGLAESMGETTSGFDKLNQTITGGIVPTNFIKSFLTIGTLTAITKAVLDVDKTKTEMGRATGKSYRASQELLEKTTRVDAKMRNDVLRRIGITTGDYSNASKYINQSGKLGYNVLDFYYSNYKGGQDYSSRLASRMYGYGAEKFKKITGASYQQLAPYMSMEEHTRLGGTLKKMNTIEGGKAIMGQLIRMFANRRFQTGELDLAFQQILKEQEIYRMNPALYGAIYKFKNEGGTELMDADFALGEEGVNKGAFSKWDELIGILKDIKYSLTPDGNFTYTEAFGEGVL